MNRTLLVLLMSASLVACSRNDDPAKGLAPSAAAPVPAAPAAPETPAPVIPAASASAVLKPASGSNVSGTVTFTATAGGVQIAADVSGLAAGAHGFHVHEKGDCSDPKAESAGPHFNPHGVAHGAPEGTARHAGDLGNVTADDTGHATLNGVDAALKLSGTESIVGRAVVIHANPDDFRSQPGGNSGARVACGVVEAATPAP